MDELEKREAKLFRQQLALRSRSAMRRVAISRKTVLSRAKKEAALRLKWQAAARGGREGAPTPAAVHEPPALRLKPSPRPASTSDPASAKRPAGGPGRETGAAHSDPARRAEPPASAEQLEREREATVDDEGHEDGRKAAPIGQHDHSSDASRALRKRFERQVRNKALEDLRKCVLKAVAENAQIYQEDALLYAPSPDDLTGTQ